VSVDIAVLDYGIGNLRSAEKALQRVGGDAALVTDVDDALGARGVVLPGVGRFAACARALEASGLDVVARQAIDDGRPFLGICIGMQLLYEGSEEDPDVPGLGVLPGKVRWLPSGVKRPQMQWNQLDINRPSTMLEPLGPAPWVYFVHSFAPEHTADVVATCEYGGPVVAAVERDNVWATQFHPEKSGTTGLELLRGFVARCAA
jgi:imidazole glycerol-phosphate synthase subunit HisH